MWILRAVAAGFMSLSLGCAIASSKARSVELPGPLAGVDAVEINVRVGASSFGEDALSATSSRKVDQETVPALEELLAETGRFKIRRDPATARYRLDVLVKSKARVGAWSKAAFAVSILSAGYLGLPERSTTRIDVELVDLAARTVVAEHRVEEEHLTVFALLAVPGRLLFARTEREARRASYRDVVAWAAEQMELLAASETTSAAATTPITP